VIPTLQNTAVAYWRQSWIPKVALVA